MEVYFIDDNSGERKGPYSIDSIPPNRIRPSTLVWASESPTSEWIRAANATYMEDYFRRIPPDPPMKKSAEKNYTPVLFGLFLLIFDAAVVIYSQHNWESIQKIESWEFNFLLLVVFMFRIISCFNAHVVAQSNGFESGFAWIVFTFVTPVTLIILGLMKSKELTIASPVAKSSRSILPWSEWRVQNPGKNFSDYMIYVLNAN